MPAQHKKRFLSAILSLAIALPATSLLCCSESDTLIILDEAYQTLDPDGAARLGKLAADMEILPLTQLSAALYRTIQEKQPARLVLSPLFAQEIPNILSEFPDTTVFFAGPPVDIETARLRKAGFSRERAAFQAGQLIGQQLSAGNGSSAGLIALIGSEPFQEDELRQFSSGFGSDLQASNRLLIIETGSSYSAELVRRHAGKDIVAAWLSVTPAQLIQYSEALLDPSAFKVASVPFAYGFFSPANVILSWDIAKAIESLLDRPDQAAEPVLHPDWKVTRKANN